MATNKRNDLTLQKKIELIKNSSGQCQRQLAEKYNIGKPNTIVNRLQSFINTTTPKLRPYFLIPWVAVILRFHCISFLSFR